MVSFRLQPVIVIFMVLVVAFLCIPTQAAVIDQVARDFKPMSGYVIMKAGSEYLIDLDAGKGI